MSWIDEVEKECEEAESPRSFIKWAAIAAIASVAGKNFYIKRGRVYDLHPNIWVLIIAGPGQRKSFPIYLYRHLLDLVGSTRVFHGTNSIQGIIEELQRSFVSETRKVSTDAIFCLVSNEFYNFLLEDQNGLSTLTEWYDTHYLERWEKRLKSGVVKLKNVCTNFYLASNEVLLLDKLKRVDIEGGFMARTLVVREKKKGKINALVEDDDGISINYEGLSERLKQISNMSGIFKWDDTARYKIFKPWYEDLQKKLMNGGDTKDKTQFLERVHDHSIKTAMCLSLAEKDELVITPDNISEGIALCTATYGSITNILERKGRSDYSEQIHGILDLLIEKRKDHKITRRALMSEYMYELTAVELQMVLDTMKVAGYIMEVEKDRENYIVLSEEWRKKLKEIE